MHADSQLESIKQLAVILFCIAVMEVAMLL